MATTRWYFKNDGKTCSSPNTIDVALYHSRTNNLHVPAVLLGMCRAISGGLIGKGRHTVSVHIASKNGHSAIYSSFLEIKEIGPENQLCYSTRLLASVPFQKVSILSNDASLLLEFIISHTHALQFSTFLLLYIQNMPLSYAFLDTLATKVVTAGSFPVNITPLQTLVFIFLKPSLSKCQLHSRNWHLFLP